MSTTRLFPLGLMLALALLTFYLERTVREDDSPPALRRHDPDYLVTNFTTTTYNRDGAAETVLSAAQMMHYPDDDTTELVAPRVVQAKPNEPRLTVRADRGQLSRDGDEIFLYDNVLLVRDATRRAARGAHDHRVPARPARPLAGAHRPPVKIVEGGRSLTGRGMEYNNESRELLLRHDVQARFEAE